MEGLKSIRNCFRKSRKGRKLIKISADNLGHVYLCLIFGIFPFYLMDTSVGGMSCKALLLAFLTVGGFAAQSWFVWQKRADCRRKLCRLDILMFCMMILGLYGYFTGSLRGNGAEPYFMTVILSMEYFLVSNSKITGALQDYLRLAVLPISCTYAVLVLGIVKWERALCLVSLLTANKGSKISLLLLGSAAGALLYCTAGRKRTAYFCFAASGFFGLLFYQDIVSLVIMGGLLCLIPLLFSPTAELIKRDLCLLFTYLFLWSNMPLFHYLAGIPKERSQYDSLFSIYLDIGLAAAGILIIRYWDKIPGQVKPDRVLLNYARRLYHKIAVAGGMFCLAAMTINRVDRLQEGPGTGAFETFIRLFRESLNEKTGTLWQAVEGYGLPGAVLFLAILSEALIRVRKNHREEKATAVLSALAFFYAAQSFFYGLQAVTAPIYVSIVTLAVFNKKERGER